MIIQPKALLIDPAAVVIVPAPSGDLALECEITSPPSQAGRTAWLYVPAGQIPALLRAARSAAIAIRSEGEHHA